MRPLDSMLATLSLFSLLSALSFAVHAQDDAPVEVEELGESTSRVCPELTTTPAQLYAIMNLAAQRVGAERVPYRSCGGSCVTEEPYKTRLSALATLVPASAGPIAVGKPSVADLDALASAMLATGRTSEWKALAGLDCNGFAGRFVEANGWTGWGPDPKNNYPPYMVGMKVPPVTSTDDICPGDLVAFTEGSHVEVVGERAGTKTEGGRTLALFQMYESLFARGLDGLHTSVQGFDITGGANGKFTLVFPPVKPGQPSTSTVVMVFPGPGAP